MKNNGFYDLHCHILYGVDDGADSFETAAEMIEMAYADGIRNICFTPHYAPNFDLCADVEACREAFCRLSEYVRIRKMDIRFGMGAEIMYCDGCVSDVSQKKKLTMCSSRYVLVELRENSDFSDIVGAMKSFSVAGYFPIAAHPERYLCIRKEPAKLMELSQHCLLQFNTGVFDRSRKHSFVKKLQLRRIAHYVLKNKVRFFVSSDSHDTKRRSPSMSRSYEFVCKKAGENFAYDAFFIIPAAIFGDGSEFI